MAKGDVRMIAPNPHLLCEEAKLYYFELLDNESDAFVPELIIDHVGRCQHCQEQISRLKGALSQAEADDGSEGGQVGSPVAIMLRLHFAYIGERVTCETARPFLAGMSDPALEIRIPTPITVHLDSCRQCAEDLETIRGLNLNPKQLHQLGQLFAEAFSQDAAKCSQMREIIKSVAGLDFGGISAETLKHLCKCPVCQGLLCQERQAICDSLSQDAQSRQFPCESVSATDIFDYVVPYGLDPGKDQYARFRESLTSHLRSCTTCLGKMQELHRVIYHMATRAESEVITIYHIDKSAKAQSLSESGKLYAGFPIRVEIAGCEDRVDVRRPARIVDFAAALKRKVSALNVRPLLRPGLAAAAVILVGLALMLNTPTAKAVTIEQICRAIMNVKNVHIRTFLDRDPTEPMEELWVSKTLKVQQTKRKGELSLLDIPNEAIAGFWGLVPFSDLSALPEDAKLNPVAANGPEAAGETEIYDWTWTEKTYGGSVVFRKCRFFIEPETNLPRRTESYQKLPEDNEYVLISWMIVEYWTDSQMQEALIQDSSL